MVYLPLLKVANMLTLQYFHLQHVQEYDILILPWNHCAGAFNHGDVYCIFYKLFCLLCRSFIQCAPHLLLYLLFAYIYIYIIF